jgi:hypothetical protein
MEQVWDELKRQDAQFGFGLRFNEGRLTVTYPGTGARLRIRSIGTRREVDKWRGKQFHRVYLDECQSVPDDVLVYAITQVIPHTLARFRGSVRCAGTPRLRCEGWWYRMTGPPGVEAQRLVGGLVMALTRPYAEREDPRWLEIDWTWSLHNWKRSANPGLPDADRETDEMRRALAASETDKDVIRVELDGEWPWVDEEARLVRFDPVSNTWDGGPAPDYGLPEGHAWTFYLGADLAMKRDLFALELFACATTSPKAYHCDEWTKRGLTFGEMAVQINRFRSLLGPKLKAIVGDTQGPTGKLIFEELTRVHAIPIEKALKGQKDDAVELFSSDLYAQRVLIKIGTELARQCKELRKPDPNLPVSKQPKQRDDAFDAALYARRRMIHVFGKAGQPPKTQDEQRAAQHRKQLRAIEERRRRAADPFAAPVRSPW